MKKRMKKTKITKLFLTLILLAIMMLILGGNVKGALQANPNTKYTKTATLKSWVKIIREMEITGGAMGLTETLNTDYTPVESNGIDVHAMRTTEYGAIAILSASGYGNSEKIATTGEGTTTGNNTGVIINTSYQEWTSGVPIEIYGVNERYFDLYTLSNSSAKRGDALGTSTAMNPGCFKWHNSKMGTYTWLVNNQGGDSCGEGGIFAFNPIANGGSSRTSKLSLLFSWCSSMWRRIIIFR